MMISASDELCGPFFLSKSHVVAYKIQSFNQWAEDIAIKKEDMVLFSSRQCMLVGETDKERSQVISDGNEYCKDQNKEECVG